MGQIASAIAFLSAALGIPFLQPLRPDFYLHGIISLFALTCLLVLFLNRFSNASQPLGPFPLIAWGYTLVLGGIQILGGLGYGQNFAVLMFFTGIISIMSKPMRSLGAAGFVLGVLGFHAIQKVVSFLPWQQPPILDLHEASFRYGPVMGVIVIIHLLFLALKPKQNPIQNTRNHSKPSSNEKALQNKPQPVKNNEQLTTPAPTQEKDEEEISNSTQYFTRAYLEREAVKEREMMKGRLDEVVYFMNRNFKAFTALGFIADNEGENFYINSIVTKSNYIDYDCVVKAGAGLVGSAVGKPNGFITGNVAGYMDGVEYYKGQETIGSIMVQRIMDNQTKKIQGLLVVDSNRNRAFTDEHKELMNRFAHIASAIATAAQINVLKNKQAAWADTQYDISKQLSEVLKVEEIIEVVINNLCKLFEHDRVVVCSYNSKSRRGNVHQIEGNAGNLALGMEFNIQNRRGLYGTVFRNRREVMVQGFRNEDLCVLILRRIAFPGLRIFL